MEKVEYRDSKIVSGCYWKEKEKERKRKKEGCLREYKGFMVVILFCAVL